MNVKALLQRKQQKKSSTITVDNVDSNNDSDNNTLEEQTQPKKRVLSSELTRKISLKKKKINSDNNTLTDKQSFKKQLKFPIDPFATILTIDDSAKNQFDTYTLQLPNYYFKKYNNNIFIEYRTNDLSDSNYKKECIAIDFNKKMKDIWFHHYFRPWNKDELLNLIENKINQREMKLIGSITKKQKENIAIGDVIQFYNTLEESELNQIYKSFTKEENVKKYIEPNNKEELTNIKFDDLFEVDTIQKKIELKDEDTPMALGSTNIIDKLNREKTYNLNELLIEDDLIRMWRDYMDLVNNNEEEEGNGSKQSLRSKIKVGSNQNGVNNNLNDALQNSTTPITNFRNEFQSRLFTILNDYRDLYFPNAGIDNYKLCVETYTLHVVNHILKTKRYEWYNDKKRSFYTKQQYLVRDDGFNCCKALIIVPNRYSAFLIIELMMELFPKLLSIRRKEAFELTFGEDEDEEKEKKSKPFWYQEIFEGNTNEDFSLGLALKENHGQLEIMAPIDEADIIIATPLGVIKDNPKKYKGYLSSVDICIVDRCEMLLMQNWEHLIDLMNKLNEEQKNNFTFDLDFDIIKEYLIHGFGSYFRQTLVFSGFMNPDINNLVTNYCKNMRGLVKVRNFYEGVIRPITGKIPQIFERINCEDPEEIEEKRFNYFANTIFPRFKNSADGRFLIICSNYVDFVRLRNYFDQYNIPFQGVSEYSTNYGKILGRFKSDDTTNYLIYTERHFYYHCPKLSQFDVNQIVFYNLPENAFIYQLWAEKAIKIKKDYPSCRILSLFTPFDALKLERIVGSKRCRILLSSDNDIHLFDK
ncbi:hypothetical protein ABK040_008156 [Willaertia magna]